MMDDELEANERAERIYRPDSDQYDDPMSYGIDMQRLAAPISRRRDYAAIARKALKVETLPPAYGGSR